MNVRVGTSGYSYKEWKGTFYPEKIAAKDMLADYATKLPAVEINNTFYRLPSARVLEAWQEQVPDTFRFAIKASRRITHLKRLKDAEDETAYLLRTVDTLGERLGVILYQLPPFLKMDLPKLEAFLGLLKGGPRAVFEFRHRSWIDDEVHACLREHGAALCLADVDGEDAPEIVPTTDWGYLRLRRQAYSDAELAAWVERIRARDWDDVYVFFKHEEGPTGPAAAARFLELAR